MTHEGTKTKQKSRLYMSHAQNDARYVKRGKMIHLVLPDNMDEELRQMNAGKNGHPFAYSVPGDGHNQNTPAVEHCTQVCRRNSNSCSG